MPADQAEVVGEDVTIQLVAKLGAECTTADTTGQAAEDGAGQRAEGDAQWTSNGADCRTGLAAGRAADAPRAAPPTVPTKAPIFMAGCRDAILGSYEGTAMT